MDTVDSTARLVDNDQLDFAQSEPEGFSSGYDSSDFSDSESSTHNQYQSYGDDSDGGADIRCDVRGDHVKYRSTSALCDHLKYILSMPELCDVTFLVGPTKVPIHGVKAILATRSRVMYQLILKNEHSTKTAKKSGKRQQSRLTIEVNKYLPEDFRKIVQFIHCGSVDVNSRSVAGLLCGARQFCLEDLRLACWDFVHQCSRSDPESLTAIQRGANQYIHHRYGVKLFSRVQHLITATQCRAPESMMSATNNRAPEVMTSATQSRPTETSV